MSIITLKNLKPGMILAQEVRDLSGRLLLGQGLEITPKRLRILKAWNITEVEVVEDTKSGETKSAILENIDPDLQRQAVEMAADHFHHTDTGHPLIAQLFDYDVKSRYQQLEKGKSGDGI